MKKKKYEKPALTILGDIAELTKGRGGSCPDGSSGSFNRLPPAACPF